MNGNRRGMLAALFAATVLVPGAASGQTGILHKRGPSLPKSFAAPRLSASSTVMGGPTTQASANPGDAATGFAVPKGICLPTPADAVGGADGIDALPIECVCPGVTGDIGSMPMPSDGNGLVHTLPFGPPGFLDFTDAMPDAADYGLARATMATTTAVENMPTARGPASLPQASAGGLPQRAVGVRPGSIVKPAAATRASAARADAPPARVQNVGDLPTTTAPRWRDRIRFAWPGSGE